MSSTAPLARDRESRRLLLTVMAALIAALAWFVSRKAHLLTDYSPASYQDLWPRRLGLVPHLLGGVTALTVGLVQVWLGLTHRTGRLHRVLGRIYVAGIVVGSIGGFYLASRSSCSSRTRRGCFF